VGNGSCRLDGDERHTLWTHRFGSEGRDGGKAMASEGICRILRFEKSLIESGVVNEAPIVSNAPCDSGHGV
jgi:hypothetical protein